MSKKLLSCLVVFTINLIFKNLFAQEFINKNAFVITVYDFDKVNSCDTLYVADLFYLIKLIEDGRDCKKIEKLFLKAKTKKWSKEKWLAKLKIENWIPLVDNFFLTDYVKRNIVSKELFSMLQKFDSTNRYKVEPNTNHFKSVYSSSFIKAYKIFGEGFIDTIDCQKLKQIYYPGIAETLSFHESILQLKKDRITKEVVTSRIEVRTKLKVNEGLCMKSDIPYLILVKGRITRDFDLIKFY